MLKIRTAAIVLATSLLLLVCNQAPAGAHSEVAVLAGTMNTSGMWYPTSPTCIEAGNPICPSSGSWTFSSDIATIGVEGTAAYFGANQISGSGVWSGWCSSSSWSGVINTRGHSANVASVGFGSTIIMIGSTSTGAGVVVATFQARPLPGAGVAPCLDHAATQSLVVGEVAVAH